MTALTAARPVPSTAQQWWVLTTRLIAPTLRNGEVAVGVAVSVAATASLYIPLNRLMDGPDLQMSSYAQYLMPLIMLQAIAFRIDLHRFSSRDRLGARDQPPLSGVADRVADPAGGPDLGQCLPLCDRAGRRAGMWLCHRLPIPPRAVLHRGVLSAGAL